MTATLSPHAMGSGDPDELGPDSFRDRQEWITHAKCRDVDPDELFVRGAAQRQAAVICRHCPVVLQCRADALDNEVEYGVWGGLTERQRRALLREHPEITSWADFYAAQTARAQGVH
ncbi:WhiB family transcriptional regulator [Corynebacterium sp. TAE3-ERU12]|uniref:WhiB family transcriptional regulator n=1 Tax=Corynebacterium sp. TAE3-ERU12 TaxID=2849491 RepID=UPI001C48FA7C|nr:WhiB family transcriptional regulator [Corynebacterium sp. TAE3-ERU12]